MSEYSNRNELFLEPKTSQHGSHMVMTNVQKQSKIKLINIDTRFRDEYNYLQSSNYNITLPERITDVKSLIITNIEIPISYYNISSNFGNNYFLINNYDVVTIPDGQYTTDSLKTAINDAINLIINPISRVTYYNNNGSTSSFSVISSIEFDINSDGTKDKYNFNIPFRDNFISR